MREDRTGTKERGAAAVEFALLLPLLVVMLMGMIDFGMAINAQAIVGNAAREGARAASFNADSALAQSVVTNASSTLLGTPPTATLTCKKMADIATNNTINCSAAGEGDVVVVKVAYTYNWISPAVLGINPSTPIESTSLMRIESK